METFLAIMMMVAIVVAIVAVIALYFLPAIVSKRRRCKNNSMIFVINLFLGWTLVGWVVALAMAFSPDVVPVPAKAIE